mmetsp:Transcript_18931/g.33018  ORF Transcript_18931/g.33018 Transcript_18931/m.33018 type:complete len:149 (+) Transcript_18931:666-1112(+)
MLRLIHPMKELSLVLFFKEDFTLDVSGFQTMRSLQGSHHQWFQASYRACYEDTGFIGETFNNFMSIIIIYFSFLYLISISISEFYINTLSFIMESKSWQQQVDASKEDDNFICNSNSLSTFVLEYFVLSPYNNTYTPSYTIQIFCCRF